MIEGPATTIPVGLALLKDEAFCHGAYDTKFLERFLADGKQIMRAALEDHFCGKLLGLPMGVDVCYTNHSYADQDDMDILLTTVSSSG